MNLPTTARDMMAAAIMTYTDIWTETDAWFIHGEMKTSYDDALLELAAQALNFGITKRLVLNSIQESECQKHNLAYAGYESWSKRLKELGVEEKYIETIPPSYHTGTESNNLITLCLDRRWNSVTVVALPQHLIRCMLQIVRHLKDRRVTLRVHARTLNGVKWSMPASKPVMGGSTIEGTLLDQLYAEYDRVEKYKEKNGSHMPHATASELIEYLLTRGV
jgi:hypothetical protein